MLIAGSSTQCLLFTEPPNVQPEVTLEGPTTVLKTYEATFTAKVTDDQDPASVRLHWFLRELTCPTSLTEAQAELLVGSGTTHPVTRTHVGPFCIGVIATDTQGASAFVARRFQVVNMRPVAAIHMLSPRTMLGGAGVAMANQVPLYSEVRLSGAASDDDDPPNDLLFRWKVRPPDGEGEPPPCTTGTTAAEGPEFCRRLIEPGAYQFELVVLDIYGESSSVSMPVTAGADTPPCFERTEPPHDLARGEDGLPPLVLSPSDRPYTFRVLEVRDDGDAYPTPTGVIPGSFSWKWRERGVINFDRLTDPTLTSFTIEANRYRPGDEVEVRVDYRDRQPLEAYPCLTDAKADRCEFPTMLPQAPCFYRVSWRVRFIP